MVENLIGISLGNNYIFGLNDNQFKIYNDVNKYVYNVPKSSSLGKGLVEIFQTLGSCFVTLNSTHFIQIGGYRYNEKSASVLLHHLDLRKLNELGPQIEIISSPLANLSMPRMQHGCTLVKMKDEEIAIIVAGGSVKNKRISKSMEYLTLPYMNLNRVEGINISSTRDWQTFTPLRTARTKYPSIGFVGTNFVAAAGACGKKNRKRCHLVEKFNVSNNEWEVFQDLQLTHNRYDHSTIQITKSFCDGKTC